MSGFETRFAAGDDAERIQTAFYGFVSAHAAEVDGDASLRTEIGNAGRELRIRLWSAEAMDAFLRGLARPVRRPAYE